MGLDRNQAADAVAQALGESSDRAEQVLRDLFREYAATTPDDWHDVRQILDSSSIVEYGQIDPLHDKLQELAGQNGDAEHPRGFFEDVELWNHYAPTAQDPDTGQVTKVPVAHGSAIYQVDQEYYLEHEGQQPVQVWPATSENGSVYYHDGTNNYDEYGKLLTAPSPAAGPAGASVPMSAEMRAHVDAVLADRPHLAEILTDEHIRVVIEELSGELYD